jgi:hypothetical protein
MASHADRSPRLTLKAGRREGRVRPGPRPSSLFEDKPTTLESRGCVKSACAAVERVRGQRVGMSRQIFLAYVRITSDAERGRARSKAQNRILQKLKFAKLQNLGNRKFQNFESRKRLLQICRLQSCNVKGEAPGTFRR